LPLNDEPAAGLFLFKLTLGSPANRADPVFGQVLKFGAGLDTVIGVPVGGIVHITAYSTDVFLHDGFLLSGFSLFIEN
jgi:hypothetical protein